MEDLKPQALAKQLNPSLSFNDVWLKPPIRSVKNVAHMAINPCQHVLATSRKKGHTVSLYRFGKESWQKVWAKKFSHKGIESSATIQGLSWFNTELAMVYSSGHFVKVDVEKGAISSCVHIPDVNTTDEIFLSQLNCGNDEELSNATQPCSHFLACRLSDFSVLLLYEATIPVCRIHLSKLIMAFPILSIVSLTMLPHSTQPPSRLDLPRLSVSMAYKWNKLAPPVRHSTFYLAPCPLDCPPEGISPDVPSKMARFACQRLKVADLFLKISDTWSSLFEPLQLALTAIKRKKGTPPSIEDELGGGGSVSASNEFRRDQASETSLKHDFLNFLLLGVIDEYLELTLKDHLNSGSMALPKLIASVKESCKSIFDSISACRDCLQAHFLAETSRSTFFGSLRRATLALMLKLTQLESQITFSLKRAFVFLNFLLKFTEDIAFKKKRSPLSPDNVENILSFFDHNLVEDGSTISIRLDYISEYFRTENLKSEALKLFSDNQLLCSIVNPVNDNDGSTFNLSTSLVQEYNAFETALSSSLLQVLALNQDYDVLACAKFPLLTEGGQELAYPLKSTSFLASHSMSPDGFQFIAICDPAKHGKDWFLARISIPIELPVQEDDAPSLPQGHFAIARLSFPSQSHPLALVAVAEDSITFISSAREFVNFKIPSDLFDSATPLAVTLGNPLPVVPSLPVCGYEVDNKDLIQHSSKSFTPFQYDSQLPLLRCLHVSSAQMGLAQISVSQKNKENQPPSSQDLSQKPSLNLVSFKLNGF